jgi:hypothetical protein
VPELVKVKLILVDGAVAVRELIAMFVFSIEFSMSAISEDAFVTDVVWSTTPGNINNMYTRANMIIPPAIATLSPMYDTPNQVERT